MGCKASKPEPGARAADAESRADPPTKVLLLGASGSGKTTLLNQLRILCGEGLSARERTALRPVVWRNVVGGAQAVVSASINGVAGRPLQGRALELGKRILVQDAERGAELSAETAAAVNLLWQDADFRATWEDHAKFQVLDGWAEFAKQCDKYPAWGGPNWIPGEMDALRAHARTKGTHDKVLEFTWPDLAHLSPPPPRLAFCDVGGLRSERRQWIHSFDRVSAFIFVVAISEYDQTLFEDDEKNRLEEALELFSEVNKTPYLRQAHLVVLLTKLDVFKHKLCDRKVPLNVSGCFPDAPTGFDLDEGLSWVKGRFLAQVHPSPSRATSCHALDVLDAEAVRTEFAAACTETIFSRVGIIACFPHPDNTS